MYYNYIFIKKIKTLILTTTFYIKKYIYIIVFFNFFQLDHCFFSLASGSFGVEFCHTSGEQKMGNPEWSLKWRNCCPHFTQILCSILSIAWWHANIDALAFLIRKLCTFIKYTNYLAFCIYYLDFLDFKRLNVNNRNYYIVI